jgi:SAM-dependent methyltransferase
VDGVNIVERQVAWARRFLDANQIGASVRIHVASAMDLPFPDGSFDVVFCLEAAHCFADKPRFLREANRVLRTGGFLLLADIVGTTHLPVVNWQPALKLKLITASNWEKILTVAGFVIKEKTMVGQAVYPGCRWWAAQTAADRRKIIFSKSCNKGASPAMKKVMMLKASILEFLYFRSVLLLLSRLRLRDFVLFVARKRDDERR